MPLAIIKITNINSFRDRNNLDKIRELRESLAGSWLQDFRVWEQRSEIKGLIKLLELPSCPENPTLDLVLHKISVKKLGHKK